ncbi:MAG: MBL fold metallo-hydrolase [Geminicoccaceae bacterium]
MKVTVLGCGTSSGVPMIGCDCAVCLSPDPRNRRLRCSVLVEVRGLNLLVDTGPDLRQQCLSANLRTVDAVLYTHAHADHIHGLDEMRSINFHTRKDIDAFGNAQTIRHLTERFEYVFRPRGEKERGWWRPFLNPIAFDGPFRVGPVPIIPFEQTHGRSMTSGFRIGGFAYSPDVDGLPAESMALLGDLDVWIVDALRETPHPSHAHLERTLSWIEELKPKRAILTHMNHEVDYETWRRDLPSGVEPAYDGLAFQLPDPPLP